jgi:hypothetical protein
MAALAYPRSLPEFQRLFPTEDACVRYLFALRWPEGWRCGAGCGGAEFLLYDEGRSVFCRGCRKKEALTAGTIMQRSKQPLLTWFYAAYMGALAYPRISAVQLQSQLGIRRYETTFQMLHKLRAAMLNPGRELLQGDVEVDETLIGGRTRKGAQMGRGTAHKALVLGAVEVRGSKAGRQHAGRLRLRVIANADVPTLNRFVRENITAGTGVRTDGWKPYRLAALGYDHRAISDKEAGGPGRALPLIHREFANLKTWLGGTHQGRVQREHLQAYLNEFVFRHNRRFWKFSAFQRLLQLGLTTRPPSYRDIYRAEGLGEAVHPSGSPTERRL